MKQFALKNRLLALIFTCIISTVGCGGQATVPAINNISAGEESSFDAEYYILKSPTADDFSYLQKRSSDNNPKIAVEASNILGYYYLRDGQNEEAFKYFIENYSRYGVTEYIKTMNELWRMDAAIATNDRISAGIWAKRVQKKLGNNDVEKALITYCKIHKNSDYTDQPYNCVVKQMESLSETIQEELLDTQLNILVTSTNNETGGVLYYYTKNFDSTQNKDFKIRMGKQYREGDWDFIIDIDNGHLAGKGYGVNFKPDIIYALENMNQFVELEKCPKILLGVSPELMPAAKALKENLNIEDKTGIGTAKNNDIEIYNINRVYVSGIRKTLSEWENIGFCAVSAGNEEEINNFVPTVKQYITDPQKQKIFILKNIDTGTYYTKNYIAYYGNTFVFPGMNLTLSDDMKQFADEYKASSGKDLTGETLLGYDMMHFINKLTVHGINSQADYVTDITGFHDGSVVRTLRGFYIDRYGKATEIEVIQPSEVFEEITEDSCMPNGTATCTQESEILIINDDENVINSENAEEQQEAQQL